MSTLHTVCSDCGVTQVGMLMQCPDCGGERMGKMEQPQIIRPLIVEFKRVPLCHCGGCKLLSRQGFITMETVSCAGGVIAACNRELRP